MDRDTQPLILLLMVAIIIAVLGSVGVFGIGIPEAMLLLLAILLVGLQVCVRSRG